MEVIVSDRIFRDYTIEVGSVGLLEFAAEIEERDDGNERALEASSEADWDQTFSG